MLVASPETRGASAWPSRNRSPWLLSTESGAASKHEAELKLPCAWVESEPGNQFRCPETNGVSMKRKRTGILRIAVVTAASLTMVFTASTAAQAHAVSITAGPGSAGLEANHLTVWVCKNAGSAPVWATLRHRDGSLRRYDGPADPGFCRNHSVGGEPTAIRLCWGSGQNTCTAFKEA